jgi:hypothetical protein
MADSPADRWAAEDRKARDAKRYKPDHNGECLNCDEVDHCEVCRACLNVGGLHTLIRELEDQRLALAALADDRAARIQELEQALRPYVCGYCNHMRDDHGTSGQCWRCKCYAFQHAEVE